MTWLDILQPDIIQGRPLGLYYTKDSLSSEKKYVNPLFCLRKNYNNDYTRQNRQGPTRSVFAACVWSYSPPRYPHHALPTEELFFIILCLSYLLNKIDLSR